jgi:ABC-type nickel/cobalt efflux system permease component RcnA
VKRREAWLLVPLACATYIAYAYAAPDLPEAFKSCSIVLTGGVGFWALWRFIRGDRAGADIGPDRLGGRPRVKRREAWLLAPLACATYIAYAYSAWGLPDTFRAWTSVLAAGVGLWASWRFLRGDRSGDLDSVGVQLTLTQRRLREAWPLIPLFGASGLLLWIYYPWNPRMVAATAVLTAGIGLWILSKIVRLAPREVGHPKRPDAGRGLDTF